ncbi:MAG: hypothetical protein DI629_16185 [Mesorhizobium amorphae]|nr:MAG: hypothetical protein DI629_16185 [Mesorhizobium amorphae]
MKKTILMGLAIVLASSMPSFAQTYRGDAREYRQERRIVDGIRRGEITNRELRQIDRQQRRIDRAQRRAVRDGYVTREERRRIERMQNRASDNIWRKKHNRRTYSGSLY